MTLSTYAEKYSSLDTMEDDGTWEGGFPRPPELVR